MKQTRSYQNLKTSSQFIPSRGKNPSINFHSAVSSRPHTPPRTPPSHNRPIFKRNNIQSSNENLNFQRSQINGRYSSDARKVQQKRSSMASLAKKFDVSQTNKINESDYSRFKHQKHRIKISAMPRFYQRKSSRKNLRENKDLLNTLNEQSQHRLLAHKKKRKEYQQLQQQSGYRPSHSNTPLSYYQTMESFNHSQCHIQSRQQNKQRPLTPNSGLAGTKQNFKNLNRRVEYLQQQQQKQQQEYARPLTQQEQRIMLQQQQQRLTHAPPPTPPPPPPPPPHPNQSSSLQNTSHYQRRSSQTPQFNNSNHKSFTEPSQQLLEQHKIPKSARLQPRQYVENPQQNRHGLQSHRGYYQNSTNPFHKAKLSASRHNNIHSQSQILYTMPSQFNGTMSYQNLPDYQPQQQKQNYKPQIQRPNQSYNGKKFDSKIPLSHMYKQNSKKAKISSKRAKNQTQQQQQQQKQYQQQYIRSKITLKNKEKMKFNLDKIDFSDLDSAFVALKSYVDHCKDASDRYTSASEIDLKQSVRIQTAGTQNLHTTNGFMELSQMQQPKELTPSQIMTNSQFEEKKTWENVEQKKYLTQQSQFPKVY